VFVRFDPTQYLDPSLYSTDRDRVKPWQQWDDERKAEASGDDRPWERWDAERHAEDAAGPPPVLSLQGSIDKAVAGAAKQADSDARGADRVDEVPPAVSQPSEVSAADQGDE
jgi:hypothetical protein